MAQAPQTYKNHIRLDPSFHFFLAPAALVLLIAAAISAYQNPGWAGAARILAGLWALVATFKIRLYALKVQDRVIRLEERLRLKEVLPADLQPQIGGLAEHQLIALRFAPDNELPGLVTKCLEGKWKGKQIKESVRTWRPDYWRV
ncbi:MAG: hypothetical protein JO062_02710 [Bryobacterales bacterium]|nr:hypothetical protein [Bryobacterales bacterium]